MAYARKAMYRNKIWNTKFMMLSFFRAVGTEFLVGAPKIAPRRCQGSHVWQKQWESQTQCQSLANQEGLIHRKTMLQPSHLPIVLPGLMSKCQKSLFEKPRNQRFSNPAISLYESVIQFGCVGETPMPAATAY